MPRLVWWALLVPSLVLSVGALVLLGSRLDGPRVLFVGGVFLLTGGYPAWRLLRPTPPRKPRALEPERDEPAPRPWIAARVWRQRLQAKRFAGLGVSEGLLGDDAELLAVPDVEKNSAPSTTQSSHVQVPPSSLELARESLRTSPAVGARWNALPWPWCCERISVLVLVNPFTDELAKWEADNVRADRVSADDVWAEALQGIRAGDAHELGSHLFQCAACGRLYARVTHS